MAESYERGGNGDDGRKRKGRQESEYVDAPWAAKAQAERNERKRSTKGWEGAMERTTAQTSSAEVPELTRGDKQRERRQLRTLQKRLMREPELATDAIQESVNVSIQGQEYNEDCPPEEDGGTAASSGGGAADQGGGGTEARQHVISEADRSGGAPQHLGEDNVHLGILNMQTGIWNRITVHRQDRMGSILFFMNHRRGTGGGFTTPDRVGIDVDATANDTISRHGNELCWVPKNRCGGAGDDPSGKDQDVAAQGALFVQGYLNLTGVTEEHTGLSGREIAEELDNIHQELARETADSQECASQELARETFTGNELLKRNCACCTLCDRPCSREMMPHRLCSHGGVEHLWHRCRSAGAVPVRVQGYLNLPGVTEEHTGLSERELAEELNNIHEELGRETADCQECASSGLIRNPRTGLRTLDCPGCEGFGVQRLL